MFDKLNKKGTFEFFFETFEFMFFFYLLVQTENALKTYLSIEFLMCQHNICFSII
jgi:hypothetical protein